MAVDVAEEFNKADAGGKTLRDGMSGARAAAMRRRNRGNP